MAINKQTERILPGLRDVDTFIQLRKTYLIPSTSVYSALEIFRPGRPVQNATLVVLLVVISALKIPKAFLIRSAAQRNFAYTFVLIFPTDLPSQIIKLISN